MVSDLMDRSRVSAAVPDVVFTTDPAACTDADVVVVDLARHSESVAAVRAAHRRRASSRSARTSTTSCSPERRADGADVVLPRSQFFRDPAAALQAAT